MEKIVSVEAAHRRIIKNITIILLSFILFRFCKRTSGALEVYEKLNIKSNNRDVVIEKGYYLLNVEIG